MDAMDLVVMSYVIMNTSLYPIYELFSCPITDGPAPEQHNDDGPHLLPEEA